MQEVLRQILEEVGKCFQNSGYGHSFDFFLGMEVSHDPANIGSCIFLPQTKYIKELASKFHLPVELRPTKPICSDFYSLLETSIHSPVITEMPYKELVGALILSWFVLDLTLHSLLHV